MECMAEMGMPRQEKTMTVNMAPSLMERPLDGDWRLSLFPRAFRMWFPTS